jgi:peptidoglycan/xylan/chitin deacetylase (PgdA/CDA1 family)
MRPAPLLLGLVVLATVGCASTDAKVITTRSSSSVSSMPMRSSSSRARVSSKPAPPPAPVPFTGNIPILVYHHIRDTKPYPKSTWSYKMSVSQPVFEKQMQWLKDKGYTTITLDEYLMMRAGTKMGIEKPVVITFDDNNLSQYDIAYPTLLKNGQTAVFYIITNRLKNASFLSEDQLREMSNAGMDIESHSVTHAIMTNLSDKRLAEEMAASKKTLEDVLGKSVSHIAYPNTAQNQRVRAAAAKAGYATATIMDPRRAKPTDDPMKLPRIMMTDDSALEKILP